MANSTSRWSRKVLELLAAAFRSVAIPCVIWLCLWNAILCFGVWARNRVWPACLRWLGLAPAGLNSATLRSRSPPCKISVIIACFNEESTIARAIETCVAASEQPGSLEIIVAVAQGTSDDTVAVAEAASARDQRGAAVVIIADAPPGRGGATRHGALASKGDLLLFLHADVELPRRWDAALRAAMAARPSLVAGAFRCGTASTRGLGMALTDRAALSVANGLFAARVRLFNCMEGDHAPFATRVFYNAMGGHPDWPLLEDIEFTRRAWQTAALGGCATTIIPLETKTDPRRWARRGCLEVEAISSAIYTAHWLGGLSASRLFSWYYSTTPPPHSARRPFASSLIPVVDVGCFRRTGEVAELEQRETAARVSTLMRDVGFFYVTNHGVPAALQAELAAQSGAFFAQPEAEKMKTAMAYSGEAGRGYFPVGGETTAGKKDIKEGMYFGRELPPSHPKVVARTPMHGANLFPSEPPELRDAVLRWMEEMEALGQLLLRMVSLGLGKPAAFFEEVYTSDPTVFLGVLNYPPTASTGVGEGPAEQNWGVGEHTDMGLLTVLWQDDLGGLQIKTRDNRWIDAPPRPNTFVVNIGDCMQYLTSGLYRSTPHRVRNSCQREIGRRSWPFFLDPTWDVELRCIELDKEDSAAASAAGDTRWDGVDLRLVLQGRTYGEYVQERVGNMFQEKTGCVLGKSR